MTIPYIENADTLKILIDYVFLDIKQYSNNLDTMINRVILTLRNDHVDDINNLVIHQFLGNATTYYSFDEPLDTTKYTIHEDFLNSLTPHGFPPHELLLKPHCPVMLLRNINPSQELCNGTRLICCRFDHNIIDAEISVGHHRGKRIFLPRIPFISIENEKHVFLFKRT